MRSLMGCVKNDTTLHEMLPEGHTRGYRHRAGRLYLHGYGDVRIQMGRGDPLLHRSFHGLHVQIGPLHREGGIRRREQTFVPGGPRRHHPR